MCIFLEEEIFEKENTKPRSWDRLYLSDLFFGDMKNVYIPFPFK